MTDGELTGPSPIPNAYKDNVEKLENSVRNIFNCYAIPYSAQAKMAADGYTTLSDLADRWDTPEMAREKAFTALGMEGLQLTSDKKELQSMRLMQTVRRAKTLAAVGGPAGAQVEMKTHTATSAGLEVVVMQNKRETMEAQWRKCTGLEPPPLDEQGSDQMIKLQWTFCEQGQVGMMDLKKVVSALPEFKELDRPTRKRQRDGNGIVTEFEEELGRMPYDKKQWERTLKIYKNNLLMTLFCFPQTTKFDVKKADLDDFYEYILGRNIALRDPEPPLRVLMSAERMAWREIVYRMHQGTTLGTALKDIRMDSLFWTREVYEKMQNQRGPQRSQWEPWGGSPTRSPHKPWNSKGSPYQVQGGGKSKTKNGGFKGDGKDKDKGLGKGKNKDKNGKKSKGDKEDRWPATWAKKDPKGVLFCANYLFRRNCSGGCGRSHACPVLKANGYICNNPTHAPEDCGSRK